VRRLVCPIPRINDRQNVLASFTIRSSGVDGLGLINSHTPCWHIAMTSSNGLFPPIRFPIYVEQRTCADVLGIDLNSGIDGLELDDAGPLSIAG
jgi:hypothetical protein